MYQGTFSVTGKTYFTHIYATIFTQNINLNATDLL